MTSMFFETSCHKCGCIDEACFVYAGPHIKQICNHCGFYQKFFDKKLIPDAKEIKLKIWFMCKESLESINEMKREIEFIDGLRGLDLKIMYWKLYLKTREVYAN